MPRTKLGLLALLFFAFAFPNTAEAAPSDLELQFPKHVQGKNQPVLTLKPQKAIKSLELKLEGEEGQPPLHFRTGPLPAKRPKAFTLKQDMGLVHYEGELKITWRQGGSESFQIKFDALRLDPLKVELDPTQVDLDQKSLVFSANNPVESVQVHITTRNDTTTFQDQNTRFDPPHDPHDQIRIDWDTEPDHILAIALRIRDIGGFSYDITLTPFSVDIPHETVVFDSGQAQIRKDQEPKLEGTWKNLAKALKDYGEHLDLHLYIAGYTDTVGDRQSNRLLSERRAKSLASWFKKRGLKIPVFYVGYGEDVLAVKTPDETDEEKNRRAKYILSSHTPSGDAVPKANWKRL